MQRGKNMSKKNHKKLVIGIVGLGVGAIHLSNCFKYRYCKVKYICDKNEKKLSFYKKKFKIPKITKNFHDIIDDEEVNVIIIATNDQDHSYQIIESFKNNKHVFVEKPMCLSPQELNDIIKIKDNKSNLRISSNLVMRTHPFFKKIIKDKKKLEKIYFLEGDYNYGRLDKLTEGWRGKIKNYSVILGGGIHLLDLILKLKNKKVKEIYTIGNKIITHKLKKIPEDFALSVITFEDGCIAKISSNFSSPTDHHHIFNLYSQNTSFFYKRNSVEQCFRERMNKSNIKVKYRYDNQMKSEILFNFFESIRNKKIKPIITEKDLFYLMKISLMLVESHKRKKIIKL